MSDSKQIQALHAGISRRDWSAVELAANALRDEHEERPARLPYELRLQISRALDCLVCEDSTPEQVDKFIEMFAQFDLEIRQSRMA